MNDKNSLLVVLNIRRMELYVKKKGLQDMVSFLKSSGRQPDKMLSQWDKGNQTGAVGRNSCPPSLHRNKHDSRDELVILIEELKRFS
jgi:hypothetical protein